MDPGDVSQDACTMTVGSSSLQGGCGHTHREDFAGVIPWIEGLVDEVPGHNGGVITVCDPCYGVVAQHYTPHIAFQSIPAQHMSNRCLHCFEKTNFLTTCSLQQKQRVCEWE